MISAKHVILAAGLVLAGGAALALGQGQGQGRGQGEPMAQFFLEWDVNADGSVTAEDVSLRRAELFTLFDLNGDAMIDADEQANMALAISGQQDANREQHGQGQGRGQGHGQGRGQGQGLGQGQGHGQGQGRGPGMDNAPGQRLHAAMTLDYNDTDGDGLISAEEWAAATPQLFAQLDGNGDGAVDTDDFRR